MGLARPHAKTVIFPDLFVQTGHPTAFEDGFWPPAKILSIIVALTVGGLFATGSGRLSRPRPRTIWCCLVDYETAAVPSARCSPPWEPQPFPTLSHC
uniref:Uncharacterized protein n=1 Tax=Oryza sativa subsp. japonica TaxID=39947 RepID=Q2QUX9_ORYSJ|nr:hypothetical protein LOC_Os12g14730 [Oryza sativa Japonica Group]